MGDPEKIVHILQPLEDLGMKHSISSAVVSLERSNAPRGR